MDLITVVVYGQKPEPMARLVAGVLQQCSAVRLRFCNSIAVNGEGAAKYAVETTSRLDRLFVPCSVLLLADQSAPRRLEMSEDTIVVTGADNRRMTRLLNGRANPVVTCGTGVRDTLTLSSSSGERAILCAQRKIPTVTGTWLEPLEFAVTINGCDMRSALLAAGAAAVCGIELSAGSLTVERDPVRV